MSLVANDEHRPKRETPDGRLPTAKDVAERAHVHPSTVSRVLNPTQRHRVRRQTARRVEKAVQELGYEANASARGLRTGRSRTVGVVIPDLTNPLFPAMVRGIEDYLDPFGYAALLYNTDSDPERERRGCAALAARGVDGVLVASTGSDLALLDAALTAGQLIVLLNRRADRASVPAVVPDDRRGMALAVEHLLALGHRAIAHLAGPAEISTTRERAASFSETMRAHGLEPDSRLIVRSGSLSAGGGTEPARRLLASGAPFTAVCAANDLLALDCIDVLREAGLGCPQDVSIVGFNDIPFADRFTPALTTLHFSHYEMGRTAAEMLMDHLTGNDAAARTVILDTWLVIRTSTAPPST
ncbi:MAG TPA: LacI family DNA-binding transcriptional regulator [Solirubrobacteraceae bacterium]|nr:LacI family DNA-binding transcriptional regulator [Solirubrobacteraceae bacterium]